MNIEKEFNIINEHLNLSEKYLKDGNKKKAREHLKKANQINQEVFEDNKNEIIRITQEAGLPVEDLLSDLEKIK